MYHALNEIITLREGKFSANILEDRNPYCISIKESDGSTTSYFFSIPIRGKSGKIINPCWTTDKDRLLYKSVGGDIFAKEHDLLMKNKTGECLFTFPDRFQSHDRKKIIRNYSRVLPTPNGVVICTELGQGREYQLILRYSNGEMKILQNDKSFTLVSKQGVPFVTVSGVFFSDSNKSVMGTINISPRKIGKHSLKLTIKPKTPVGNIMHIDIAFYSPTLFSDATIESIHPSQNNPYGSSACLGKTIPYGEQWLYCKLNHDLISEYKTKKIKSALWHIPQHTLSPISLDFFPIQTPINIQELSWGEKINCVDFPIFSTSQNGYISFDVTKHIRAENTHRFKSTFQGILKNNRFHGNSATISTNDSNYAPQILEINFL